MIEFPSPRPKDKILSEFKGLVAEYHALPEEDKKRAFKLRDTIRKLAIEHQVEVLAQHASEEKAVRLYRHGDKFYVETYESNGKYSIRGHLFFGGTEDEDRAREEYEKETNSCDTI